MISDIILPVAIFSLMFALGLSLAKEDFLAVARSHKSVVACMVSLLVLVPLIGIMVARIAAPSPWLAVGIVLVAACPGGTFSNLLTAYAKGDLALSISLTTLTSLIAVFSLPLYVSIALDLFVAKDEVITLPFVETVLRISALNLLPVVLGMLVNRLAPATADRLSAPLRNLAAGMIIIIFTIIMIDQRNAFLDAMRQVALPIFVLNISCVVTGYIVATVCGMTVRQKNAAVIEHSIKQEGSGVYIALTILGAPIVALPLLTNTAIGLIVASLVTLALSRIATRHRGRAENVSKA